MRGLAKRQGGGRLVPQDSAVRRRQDSRARASVEFLELLKFSFDFLYLYEAFHIEFAMKRGAPRSS